MSLALIREVENRCKASGSKHELFTLDRKIERVSRVKPSILGYGHKGKCMSYLESKLELNCAVALEFDPTVEAYLTQPASFYIQVDGRKVRHTPDILVKFYESDNAVSLMFIQVKPSSIAYSPEYQRKFLQYRKFFNEELNMPYELMTEEALGCKKTIANRQQLFHFLSESISNDAKQSIITQLPESFTVAELESVCKQSAKTDFFAWALIAHGHIKFDSSKLLTRQSIVSIA